VELVIMKISNRIAFASAIAMVCSLNTAGSEIEFGSEVEGDEDILFTKQLGKGEIEKVKSGYLFIDFRYIEPPYRIQRIGQGIVVNGVLVNILYRGKFPKEGGKHWTEADYGFGPDTLARAAKMNAFGLKAALSAKRAIFLSREQKYGERKPGRDRQTELRMPIVIKCKEDVLFRAVETVTAEGTVEERAVSLGALNLTGLRLDEDRREFLEKFDRSEKLLERVRKRQAELDAKRDKSAGPRE